MRYSSRTGVRPCWWFYKRKTDSKSNLNDKKTFTEDSSIQKCTYLMKICENWFTEANALTYFLFSSGEILKKVCSFFCEVSYFSFYSRNDFSVIPLPQKCTFCFIIQNEIGEKAATFWRGVLVVSILKTRVYIRYETWSHLSPRINWCIWPSVNSMQKRKFGS